MDKGVSLVSLIITIVVIMVLTCVIIFQEHTLSDASVLGNLENINYLKYITTDRTFSKTHLTYYYDIKTKVMYVSTNKNSLTVMLDAEGKPILYDSTAYSR